MEEEAEADPGADQDAEAADSEEANVYTKLTDLMSQNPETEALTKLKERKANGQNDWKVLKLYYKGDELYSIRHETS